MSLRAVGLASSEKWDQITFLCKRGALTPFFLGEPTVRECNTRGLQHEGSGAEMNLAAFGSLSPVFHRNVESPWTGYSTRGKYRESYSAK